MNITLKQLRAAVGVARTGSFRAAAQANHVSPPALSIAIAELERELGIVLFDRTSRKVTVAEAGQRFIEDARRVVADVERMLLDVGDVAAARSGSVTIACVASVAARVMPDALQQTWQSFPGIEMRFIDAVGSEVIASVRDRQADFGLTSVPQAPVGDIVFEPLRKDVFHLMFPRNHRLRAKRTVTWNDLDGETFIAMNSATSSSVDIVERELRRQSIRPARTVSIAHLSVAHGMVAAGFGVCALPELALPSAAHRLVGAAPLSRPRVFRTIGICRLRSRPLSPAATAALQIVRQLFERPEPWR